MNDIEISFIIPMYNENIEQLRECIESIEKQKIENYEIVLINDGSTDEKVELFCKDKMAENINIKYIYQDNQGSAVARNKGLDIAKGKYIAFVDADDLITDNYYDEIKLKLDNGTDIYVYDYSVYNSENESRITLNSSSKLLNDDINDILANIMFYPGKMNDFMFGSIWR